MQQVYTKYSASISELKKNPSALISNAKGTPIAVLNHNKPTAYLVPAETYEKMMDLLDDAELRKIVTKRLAQLDEAVEVDIASL